MWHDGERFRLIAKDLTGRLTGALGNGVHATSDDGVRWRFADPVLAWDRDLTRTAEPWNPSSSSSSPHEKAIILHHAGHVCSAPVTKQPRDRRYRHSAGAARTPRGIVAVGARAAFCSRGLALRCAQSPPLRPSFHSPSGGTCSSA